MAIITISRGTYAGGEMLAQLLAERLSYRMVSREQLYQKVQDDYSYKVEEIAELLEQAPSMRQFEITERRRRISLGERRRQFFVALQAALCEMLREDDVVYHGQAGHLLLPGIAHVLRVRLIAPRSMRMDLAVSRKGMSRAEASRLIDQVDSERTRWTQSFFGVNWGDPLLFDLVVNLEAMTIEDAAEVVTRAASLPSFRVTVESHKRMEDLTLASRVIARLNSNPATSSISLEVIADGGVIKLSGITHRGDIDWVTKVVQKIEGVKGIDVAEWRH